MKISGKLVLAFCSVVVLMLVCGGVSVIGFSRTKDAIDFQEVEMTIDLILNVDMHREALEVHVYTLQYLGTGNELALDDAESSYEELLKAAEAYAALEAAEEYESASQEEEIEASADILTLAAEYKAAIDEAIAMKAGGASVQSLFEDAERTIHPAFVKLEKTVSANVEHYLEEYHRAGAIIDSTRLVSMVLVITLNAVAIILGLVLAFALSRGISRPLVQLTKVAEEISTGDVSRSVVIDSKDEIGTLSRAFERMRISLQKLMERSPRKKK